MSARSPLLAVKSALCLALLCPAAFSFQSPGQPPKLVIQSIPTGAKITINGKIVGQTDATFVVSPGKYTVSVASSDGKLNCKDKVVTVSFAQTLTITCSSAGWNP
jgi:hypothetical protein